MLFTLPFLKGLFPDTKGAIHDQFIINQVTTDSRKPMSHALFVPLVGDKFDGHAYMNQAIEQGAVATIWEKDKPLPKFLPTDFPVFFVKDTLIALQQLAQAYRLKINPTVIGVTGSNGKTTTKDLIATVLSSRYRTHYTNGNFNNHIGLPLTILSMPNDTEMLVLEMGMNHFGEMERLSNISEPDIAVITNIGESHIEYLGSRAGIAKAKAEILSGLKVDGTLLIDGDEPLLLPYSEQVDTTKIGFDLSNDIVIDQFNMHPLHSSFRLMAKDTYEIPLLGKHHAQNAAFAIQIAVKLGMECKEIQQALLEVDRTGMRFEVMNGRGGVTLINDAYNASPTSMKAAINVVKEITGYERKIVVLGDMFELGNASKEFHRSIADVLSLPIEYVCTIGEDAIEISKAVNKQNPLIHTKHFANKEEAITFLEAYLDEQTLILVKASRGMQLETIIDRLL
ncbi:UDP-N-acetylmuramoyl-tripeptide--D-alanyl-D-alanine ligase [Paraliobacillus sp. X-1268]|uniref:UDP-N-acetylmuramoyl-tripeptide--D-alanyl-D- alanine ligase n=1 Tax=Paraliobacillus sp. X-1268 TaxID=2213193 RepID=UPI000E3DE4DC|nr:UDP-N-acetylmuramoyl-tripeptide--D-alanyl-D-alanine ligase [Paraliobacillus sp. X-1268]